MDEEDGEEPEAGERATGAAAADEDGGGEKKPRKSKKGKHRKSQRKSSEAGAQQQSSHREDESTSASPADAPASSRAGKAHGKAHKKRKSKRRAESSGAPESAGGDAAGALADETEGGAAASGKPKKARKKGTSGAKLESKLADGAAPSAAGEASSSSQQRKQRKQQRQQRQQRQKEEEAREGGDRAHGTEGAEEDADGWGDEVGMDGDASGGKAKGVGARKLKSAGKALKAVAGAQKVGAAWRSSSDGVGEDRRGGGGVTAGGGGGGERTSQDEDERDDEWDESENEEEEEDEDEDEWYDDSDESSSGSYSDEDDDDDELEELEEVWGPKSDGHLAPLAAEDAAAMAAAGVPGHSLPRQAYAGEGGMDAAEWADAEPSVDERARESEWIASQVLDEEVLFPVLDWIWEVAAEQLAREQEARAAESFRRRSTMLEAAEAAREAARKEAARRSAKRFAAAKAREHKEMALIYGDDWESIPARCRIKQATPLRPKRGSKELRRLEEREAAAAGKLSGQLVPTGVNNAYPHAHAVEAGIVEWGEASRKIDQTIGSPLNSAIPQQQLLW